LYFLYVDESGNRDPNSTSHIYVLAGVSLYEMNWFGFENYLNGLKLRMMDRIRRTEGLSLDLCQCEVKSGAIRIPTVRDRHPFLSHLTDGEVQELVDGYYRQLEYHAMRIFAVVIDKRYLHDYMDQEKLHRKAYELLIERVQWFMRNEHRRHKALMIVDDTSRQMNVSLAMKHSYFQREGTSSGATIGHIVELPMFVASELSNGVQLADLCAYNIYRAFCNENLDYPFFSRIEAYLYRAKHRGGPDVEGLKVFPDESPLVQLAADWCGRQAGLKE